ncbi:hypothetical protein [Gordonia terrae]|uniref:hypothetical protein n=1 Tax=Gordonia terrae TaxID=2055 RepID=UPI00039E3A20|nr:hypothetical protein [Gordonia terrae]
MSGTLEGGLKAAAKNKAKHGKDFYARIGAMGGKVGRTGGFASYRSCSCKLIKRGHHVAQCAGLKGGRKSRRGPIKEVSDE